MWPDGAKKMRFDLEAGKYGGAAGDVVAPALQRFLEPVRYLALKPFTSRKFPGLKKHFGTSESVKTGGNQIEYEDEDPRIRQIFEEELDSVIRSKAGWTRSETQPEDGLSLNRSKRCPPSRESVRFLENEI